MDAATIDVNRVLTLGPGKRTTIILLYSLAAVAFGLLFVFVPGSPGEVQMAGWLVLALGVFMGGYELSKTSRPPKPLAVLSPKGIHMYIEGATEFDIPWPEVRGIDVIDIDGPRGTVFERVPVVLVDRAFYDRVIHVDSFIRRGPGWDSNFVARDGAMQVALHPSILPIGGPQLLAEIEARYAAFGAPATGN